MRDFIGFLLQHDLPRLTSSTVKEEAERRLVPAVNEWVDSVIPRKLWQFRRNMIEKCKGRLHQLWNRLCVRSLQKDPNRVKKFYQRLLSDPLTKARLERLRNRRKRKSLLPGDPDMDILSEAATLAKRGASTHFVSKDGHFTEFPDEIEQEFGLKVLSVQGLIQFKIELENSLAKMF